MNLEIESNFQIEFPYLAQNLSWKEGMRYKYSPDYYPLSEAQLGYIRCCGELMGTYITRQFPDTPIIEYRIDFVLNRQGKPCIAEVQTDDRGIPAISMTRNARQATRRSCFPGVPESFVESLKYLAQKENPSLLICYPDEEYFYYAGFYDFANLCWAADDKVEVLVAPRKSLRPLDSGTIRYKVAIAELETDLTPDFVWDFSNSLPCELQTIQPVVSKQILLDVWSSTKDPLAYQLRAFIPEAIKAENDEVIKYKYAWILKPLSGKWSRGVLIGKDTPQQTWEEAISSETNLIAQRFIQPTSEPFCIRQKEGKYNFESMFVRLEGYYCLSQGEWKLADVLATCTPTLPVHGKRDCIMIPGEVIK